MSRKTSDQETAPTPCHISFTHGYPNSKNKQKKALWNTTSFKVKSYAYAGIIKKDFSSWSDYGKRKENSTCMSYGKTSENNTPVYPKGISGGGLWVVPDMLKPDEFYLDSILIEYHERKSIVFATKIKQVLNFIREISKTETNNIQADV